MKGAQVVLAWDDRRQTPRIVSTFFHTNLAPRAIPEIYYVSSQAGCFENKHPSAFDESSRTLRLRLGRLFQEPSRDSAEAKYHPLSPADP